MISSKPCADFIAFPSADSAYPGVDCTWTKRRVNGDVIGPRGVSHRMLWYLMQGLVLTMTGLRMMLSPVHSCMKTQTWSLRSRSPSVCRQPCVPMLRHLPRHIQHMHEYLSNRRATMNFDCKMQRPVREHPWTKLCQAIMVRLQVSACRLSDVRLEFPVYLHSHSIPGPPLFSPNPSRINTHHVSSAARTAPTAAIAFSHDRLHVREIDFSTVCPCKSPITKGARTRHRSFARIPCPLYQYVPPVLFPLMHGQFLVYALCAPMYLPAAPDFTGSRACDLHDTASVLAPPRPYASGRLGSAKIPIGPDAYDAHY